MLVVAQRAGKPALQLCFNPFAARLVVAVQRQSEERGPFRQPSRRFYPQKYEISEFIAKSGRTLELPESDLGTKPGNCCGAWIVWLAWEDRADQRVNVLSSRQ